MRLRHITSFELICKTVSSKYYRETILQITSLWPAEGGP